MANPLWKIGMAPCNPLGRPKHSVTTTQGIIERLIKRKYSSKVLDRMVDKLTAAQQADFFLGILPYALAKKQPDTLSATDIDKLYAKLDEALNNQTNAKTG